MEAKAAVEAVSVAVFVAGEESGTFVMDGTGVEVDGIKAG
jgi:hypothetical protein